MIITTKKSFDDRISDLPKKYRLLIIKLIEMCENFYMMIDEKDKEWNEKLVISIPDDEEENLLRKIYLDIQKLKKE